MKGMYICSILAGILRRESRSLPDEDHHTEYHGNNNTFLIKKSN
jgi:hypothetical protein